MATSITSKEICNGRGYGDHIITIHGKSLSYTRSGGYYSNPITVTSKINNIPEMFLKMLKILDGIVYESITGNGCGKLPGIEMIQYISDNIVPVFTNLEKKTEMLKEQLNQQDLEIKSLKKQVRIQDALIDSLYAEIEDLTKMNERFAKELNQLKQESERNNAEIEDLKETTTHYNQALKEALKEFNQDLSEKDEEIEDLTKMNNRFAKELNHLKQESGRNNAEITDLKETTTHYNQALKEINKDLTESADNLEKAERQNQEMTHLNHRLIIGTSFIACRNKTHFDCEF